MKKTIKKEKKTKLDKKDKTRVDSHLINATFFSKTGKKVNVADVIQKEDCWFLKKANSWILTHNAIKIIANIAGISKNYDVEESANIVPDYKNELEHIVRVTIHCNAKTKKKDETCVHSDENNLTITGEANRINTPNRGRGYLRKMSEKRAFDIAVLEHLGLYSSVFSEEESDKFEQKKEKEPDILPGTKDFEVIVPEINLILNSKTLADLKVVGKKIKDEVKENKFSENQVVYLRELYQKEFGKKNAEF